MAYVDGFVLPVPRKKLQLYRRISSRAGKIWRDYGALEYRECVGDDLKNKMGMPFQRTVRSKPNKVFRITRRRCTFARVVMPRE